MVATLPPHHGSLASRILVWVVSLLVVSALLVAAVFGVPAVRNTDRTVSTGAKSDQLAACARQLRSDVDTANANLQVSIARTIATSTTLNGITVSYVHAVQNGDIASQDDLLVRAATAVKDVHAAAATMDTAADVLDSATHTYAIQADLSYQNPTKFLALCKRNNP